MRYSRLTAKSVASLCIDGTENRFRIVRVHECARTVVNRLTCYTHVVGIHDSVNKSNAHPIHHQVYLNTNDFFQQRQIWIFCLKQLRVMSCNGIVGQCFNIRFIFQQPRVFKSPNAQMTRSHSRQEASFFHSISINGIARTHHSQRSCSWNIQGVNSLTHDCLAQHGFQRCSSISSSRKGRCSTSLQMNIVKFSFQRFPFIYQTRSSIAEHIEMSKLMPRIGHSQCLLRPLCLSRNNRLECFLGEGIFKRMNQAFIPKNTTRRFENVWFNQCIKRFWQIRIIQFHAKVGFKASNKNSTTFLRG